MYLRYKIAAYFSMTNNTHFCLIRVYFFILPHLGFTQHKFFSRPKTNLPKSPKLTLLTFFYQTGNWPKLHEKNRFTVIFCVRHFKYLLTVFKGGYCNHIIFQNKHTFCENTNVFSILDMMAISRQLTLKISEDACHKRNELNFNKT